MTHIDIRELTNNPSDLVPAYPVMAQLRPDLGGVDDFVAQVQQQMAEEKFRLVAALDGDGAIRGLAGFRLQTLLFRGRGIYVDDLVTDANVRSLGYGTALFDWLVAEARRLDCRQLSLDSGVQRFDAHRFYLRKRMAITGHHFTLRLAED